MAEVTASLVKELRDKTGAGMMDCKNALVETNGDIEESIDWLRKKGISGAEKKSARVAADGVIAVSVNNESAALVEINSETDFVSRNPDFQDFARKCPRAKKLPRTLERRSARNTEARQGEE